MKQIFVYLTVFLVVSNYILSSCASSKGEKQTAQRPRILISTDIGGTDPDDNQSMAHFLMYCNVSSK
ncbi:MAG: nucleoside hydrolase-like domain-containing protein [Bacteroides stercoris]|jgi:hypothetical protein